MELSLQDFEQRLLLTTVDLLNRRVENQRLKDFDTSGRSVQARP